MLNQDMKEVLKQAKALFDRGQLQESRALLDQALKENPRETRILTFLAYLCFKLGDLRRSWDLYRRLTVQEPDNLSLWSNMGLVAYRMGLFEEAGQAFEEYLRRRPEDDKIREYLAMTARKLGRPGESQPVSQESEARPLAAGPEAGDEGFHFAQDSPAPAGKEGGPSSSIPLEEWLRAVSHADEPAAGHFRSLSPSMAAVRLGRRIIFALPCLSSYQGITVFEQGPNPYGKIPREFRSDDLILMAAEGNGTIWLSHAGGGMVTLGLERDTIMVNAHRLAAFDSSLRCEWLPVGNRGFLQRLAALRLSGSGEIILSAGADLVCSPLRHGTAVYLRPASVVAWTDGLEADVDSGEDLKKVRDFFEDPFLRLEGAGRVMVTGASRP